MGGSLLHRWPYLGGSQEAPSGRKSYTGQEAPSGRKSYTGQEAPRFPLLRGPFWALSGPESGGPSGLLQETLSGQEALSGWESLSE